LQIGLGIVAPAHVFQVIQKVNKNEAGKLQPLPCMSTAQVPPIADRLLSPGNVVWMIRKIAMFGFHIFVGDTIVHIWVMFSNFRVNANPRQYYATAKNISGIL